MAAGGLVHVLYGDCVAWSSGFGLRFGMLMWRHRDADVFACVYLYVCPHVGLRGGPYVCLRGVQSVDDVVLAQNKVQNHIPILHPLQMFLPWTPLVDNVYVRWRC